MEFSNGQLKEITAKLFDYKCPICQSIDKFVEKSPVNLVYFPTPKPESPKDFTYLTCVLAICQECGYIMTFNQTPHVK